MNDYTNRESLIFNGLADDLSRQVFNARKRFAESCEITSFQEVFEKPEQFHAIMDTVRKNKYAIYGAGIIARRAKQVLESWGAWDNCTEIWDRNNALHGQRIGNIEITSPPTKGEVVSADCILIAVYNGNTKGFKSAIEYINTLGVPNVFEAAQIVDNIPLQYFDRDIIIPRLIDQEVFVDGGCFDFGTSKHLLQATPEVSKIYAFEPAVEMLPFVQRGISDSGFQNIQLENAALWSSNTVLNFSFADSGGSHVSSDGEKVRAVALDSLIPVNERVTFIKLDVEGGELETLKGAKRIISAQLPKLAISIYHKPDDYIDIMEYIMNIAPKYKFYMRHYSAIDVETVLYAVI